jgi:hypothetical protein
MVDILELALVLEFSFFVNSFLKWLELEAILPDEELEYHANIQFVLQVVLLINLQDG